VRGVKLLVGAVNAARARAVLGETQPPPEVIESERETRLAEEKVRGARHWNAPVVAAYQRSAPRTRWNRCDPFQGVSGAM
jgi:hypothetical protein